MIRHLSHTEIDKQRWDRCIDRSVNRMPYAYAWWLDAACPEWEALVQDDYSAVMPLTRNRKLGISYLFQPFFTQQLGVFSPLNQSLIDISLFLNAIPSSFRYIDIQLNSGNIPTAPQFNYTSRRNCILDLSPSYDQLAGSYHRNCRRNIRKAIHAGLRVKPGPGPSVFTYFIRRHLEHKLTNTRRNFYRVLQLVTNSSIQKGTGEILGVYDRGDDLVAAGWFVQAAGRYTFLVCTSTPAGKKNHAMFFLVNHAIREKAGTGLIFDFAGSKLPGITYFNKGFGAIENYYPSVKRNLLPWPLNIIKR